LEQPGVVRKHFGLSAMSIDAYMVGNDKGDTLAASNLAQLLLNVGFLDEAEKYCEQARQTKGYHQNVDSTLADIKGRREIEAEKEDGIVAEAAPASKFYAECGRAMTRSWPENLTRDWKMPNPEHRLNIEIRGDKFIATGDYRVVGGLAGIMSGNALASEEHTVDFRGVINGCAVIGNVTRAPVTPPAVTSLLSSIGNTAVSFVMVLSDDQQRLEVMESSPWNPRFYRLTAVEPALLAPSV
jgi:hypothetical protein